GDMSKSQEEREARAYLVLQTTLFAFQQLGYPAPPESQVKHGPNSPANARGGNRIAAVLHFLCCAPAPREPSDRVSGSLPAIKSSPRWIASWRALGMQGPIGVRGDKRRHEEIAPCRRDFRMRRGRSPHISPSLVSRRARRAWMQGARCPRAEAYPDKSVEHGEQAQRSRHGL